MWRHTESRVLDVPLEAAYRWLTDYGPGDAATLGYDGGSRTVEKLADERFRLVDEHAKWGRPLRFDGVAVLRPPDAWDWSATILLSGREVARITGAYRLERLGDKRCRFTASFVAEGRTILARLFLVVAAGRIRRDVRETYDIVAAEVASDAASAA